MAKTKKIKWTYLGMASMGDSDGPISVSVATVNGKKLQKYVPMRRSIVYYCEGQRFRTLNAALAAAKKLSASRAKAASWAVRDRLNRRIVSRHHSYDAALAAAKRRGSDARYELIEI